MASTPPPDRIQLRGIRALGLHGALPEERQRPQPFVVDLDVDLDLAAAGDADDLTCTIDYGALAAAVQSVITSASSTLLENLATRIADAVLDLAGDHRVTVTVTVHKIRPPVPVDMESAGVRITRARF